MRYVYGITAALLLGGAAATLTLQPGRRARPPRTSPARSPAAPRAGAPMSFADLAARLQPAVVNISTRSVSRGQPAADPLRGILPPLRRPVPAAVSTAASSGGNGQPVTRAAARSARASSSRPTAMSSPTTTSSRRRATDATVESDHGHPGRPHANIKAQAGRPRPAVRPRGAQDRRRPACPSSASAIRPAPGSATGWSRSAIRSASAAPSPRASSRRSTAITGRRRLRPLHPDRRRRSIWAIRAARCSI